MTVNKDLHSSVKKSSESGNDLPIFSTKNLQSNLKSYLLQPDFFINHWWSGCGNSGTYWFRGLCHLFLIMAMTSLGLAAKAKFSINSYFDYWNRIAFEGFLGGLMSFVLFWTFAYDIVHIF